MISDMYVRLFTVFNKKSEMSRKIFSNNNITVIIGVIISVSSM